MNRTGENVELLPVLGTAASQNRPPDGRRGVAGAETRKRGMVLPFTPLSITFDDIKYSVDMPQGVSGAFRPVSGAGKTTLMDVLAGRKTGGHIEGDISISGYPKKQEKFARSDRWLL